MCPNSKELRDALHAADQAHRTAAMLHRIARCKFRETRLTAESAAEYEVAAKAERTALAAYDVAERAFVNFTG